MNKPILERMSYEHNLRHSYIHISAQSVDPQSYELKLLRETSVPDTLPLSIRPDAEDPTQATLEYEVSGLESMASYYASRKLRYLALAQLMENIHGLLGHLEEYFLPEDMVLLDPSAIFYNPEKESWIFTLVPGYSSSFHEALKALIAWLLKRIDYNEDRVVVLAYTLYNESLKEFLVMENLLRICRQNIERERMLQLERSGGRAATAAASSLGMDSRGAAQAPASGLFAADERTAGSAPRPRMISTDGIFRPIDAGLSETIEGSEPQAARPAQSSATAPDNIRFPSDYGEDEYSKTVRKLQEHTPGDAPAYEHDASLCTNYAGFDDPALDGVSVSSLVPTPEVKRSFPLFRRRKDGKSEKTERRTKKNVEKSTLKKALSTEQSQSSFKAKTLLSVALMILIPFLIWFLKGGLVLRRMLPLVLALEAGILVVIALDYLMAKLPDD